MTSQQKTLELIASREPRFALKGELYHDREVYQQDLQQIWHREWIFWGHSFELAEVGQYQALQIGDYSIVVVRADNGQIKAYHNACPSTGEKLVNQATGQIARFFSPDNQLAFGLDGQLLVAEVVSGDESEPVLKPVHLQVVDTYIYVCLAQSAPDFEAFRQDLAPFIAPHNLEHCKVAFESNIVEKGNWKLVFENNRECYHCDANHPELINSFVENPSVAGVGGDEDPELAAHWDKCEAAGFPSRLFMNDSGQYRMTRIPLAPGAVSYTMDGKPAVNGRLDTADAKGQHEEDIGALLYFHYPSTWNHFLGDHALSFRILPLGRGETLVTTKWLVNNQAQEGVDYDLDTLTKVWLATNDQDRELVEETFQGTLSPIYQPGPFSDIAENGVCQFVDWYCETMLQKLRA